MGHQTQLLGNSIVYFIVKVKQDFLVHQNPSGQKIVGPQSVPHEVQNKTNKQNSRLYPTSPICFQRKNGELKVKGETPIEVN